jgi:uncharacterized membrane protein
MIINALEQIAQTFGKIMTLLYGLGLVATIIVALALIGLIVVGGYILELIYLFMRRDLDKKNPKT